MSKAIGECNGSCREREGAAARCEGVESTSYGRFLVFLCFILFLDFTKEFEEEAIVEGEEDGALVVFHTPSIFRFIWRIVRLKIENVSRSC
jgi:hypothetical protein